MKKQSGILGLGHQVLGIITFLVMSLALYMVFIWSPLETTMREVQKIFYFHVGTALVGFFAFFVVFVCSIMYLKTKDRKWDIIAASAAEIGVIFITLVIITGPIWAKSAWNTWWTWEPRLTTSLILWFIYIAYVLVRASSVENEKKARLSAIFGIIGFVDVPIVFLSIYWWSVAHPFLIENGKMNLEPAMFQTMMVSVLAFTLLFFYLLQKGIAISQLQDKVNAIKGKLREKYN